MRDTHYLVGRLFWNPFHHLRGARVCSPKVLGTLSGLYLALSSLYLTLVFGLLLLGHQLLGGLLIRSTSDSYLYLGCQAQGLKQSLWSVIVCWIKNKIKEPESPEWDVQPPGQLTQVCVDISRATWGQSHGAQGPAAWSLLLLRQFSPHCPPIPWLPFLCHQCQSRSETLTFPWPLSKHVLSQAVCVCVCVCVSSWVSAEHGVCQSQTLVLLGQCPLQLPYQRLLPAPDPRSPLFNFKGSTFHLLSDHQTTYSYSFPSSNSKKPPPGTGKFHHHALKHQKKKKKNRKKK